MSLQNLSNTESYLAEADLSSSKYLCVALGTDGTGVDVAGAGVKAGILQNAPVSGAIAEVAFQDGQTSYAIVVDATSATGDLMKSDAAGKLTVTTTAGDEVVAEMLAPTTAANDIGKVRIVSRVAD